MLSLVWTEPRGRSDVRSLREEETEVRPLLLCDLCWCLHTISKAEDVICDENKLLADVRFPPLQYVHVVFHHLDLAVIVHLT